MYHPTTKHGYVDSNPQMIPRGFMDFTEVSPLHLLSSPAPGESYQIQGAVQGSEGDFGEEVRCRGHRIQGIQDH